MTTIEPDPDRATPPTRLLVRQDGAVPVIIVPTGMPFERLREWMRTRLPEVLPDVGGRSSRLDLGDREIELFDVRRLLHLLRDEFQIEVTGLYVRSAAIHRYAERELKLKLFAVPHDAPGTETDHQAIDPTDAPEVPGLADALAALREAEAPALEDLPEDDDATDSEVVPDTFEPAAAQRRAIPLPELPKEEEPDTDEHGGKRALAVHRTLRSGSSLRYDGDVHVFGDVNAGAQIRAGGNVIVFGRLRGMIHAGALGDDSAFILAFELAPTQLRIARHIAIAPDRPAPDAFAPEIARVEEDKIVIEPYRGRVPHR